MIILIHLVLNLSFGKGQYSVARLSSQICSRMFWFLVCAYRFQTKIITFEITSARSIQRSRRAGKFSLSTLSFIKPEFKFGIHTYATQADQSPEKERCGVGRKWRLHHSDSGIRYFQQDRFVKYFKSGTVAVVCTRAELFLDC